MSLDVEINSKQYSLLPDRENNKVVSRPVQQFVQSQKTTGRTRPEDVANYESFIIPNLMNGFGRARINSDVAFDPSEYRRFFDSTCDTRWADRIYLPVLSESATATSLDIARASAEFKGETNVLFESAGNVVNRQFTGASDTWENGGTVNDPYKSVTSDTSNTGANQFTVSHTTVGANRCLVAVILCDTQFSDPSTIAYNSVNMTKATTWNDTTGTGVQSGAIYYLVNPTIGTNDFVVQATRGGGGNYLSGDAFSIFLINLTGIDQDSPLRNDEATGTPDGGAVTSITDDITTVAGDLVIAASAISDGPTITAGAGQTEIVDIVSSSNHSFNISTKTATTTTTTMSYSFGASENAVLLTAAFTPNRSGDEASVALDMITHKNKLIAMTAEDQSQLVYTSSDGATWTPSTTPITASLLLNDITSDEDIDAGLFVEIGGDLIALVWHEDNGTITAFTSTNGGTAFSDESNFDIASANGPQGAVVYPDIDGSNKIYLGTAEGLYIVDTSPSDWTFELVFPMNHSTDNCRRMTVHEGSIWFSQGVDNDSPAPIYKLTVQGNSRIIESNYGLSFGDGVPSNLLGPIRWMKSTGDQLFISIGGGAASRNARILAWNGKGWHHMTKFTTANNKINWMTVGSGDDGVPRLHYGVKTSSSASSFKFLEQPLVNPRSGVTIKREDLSGTDSGTIELPFFDFGIPHENKAFLAAHVSADDLTSNEKVEFFYGINGADDLDQDLGDFTSSVSKLLFASGAGISAKNIGILLKLDRGGTNTLTPKIRDITLEGYVVPGLAQEHRMTIDIDATARDTGQSIETVISNLETLLGSVVQTQFKFGQVDKYVAVDRERSTFNFGIDAWEASGAPNALSERTGTFSLVLIEKVVS
jgi:hypothetical protein